MSCCKLFFALCSLAGVALCASGAIAQSGDQCVSVKSNARKFTTCDPNTNVRCRPDVAEWTAGGEFGVPNKGTLYWFLDDDANVKGWINKAALTDFRPCTDNYLSRSKSKKK